MTATHYHEAPHLEQYARPEISEYQGPDKEYFGVTPEKKMQGSEDYSNVASINDSSINMSMTSNVPMLGSKMNSEEFK